MAFGLSIIPFVFFIFLLLIKKASLLKTSIFTLFLVLGLAVFYWQIQPGYLIISGFKGLSTALDIFLIITGALFFLGILRHLRIIDSISFYLQSVSNDYRVKVIMLAWFLESFIEGTAGFGTPAIIVAPLLVSVGLAPITAVIISLLGNSTAVVFGAAGTPIRVGLAGLAVASVPWYAAFINLVGFLVPTFMVWFLVANRKDRKEQFFEVLPFAVWSGLAFVLPSVLFVSAGQEFPSILGSLTGFGLAILGLKMGLAPKTIRVIGEESIGPGKIFLLKTFSPYMILIGLLVLGKLFLGPVPLNPGLAFVAAGLTTVVIFGKQKYSLTEGFREAIKKAMGPFVVILSMAIMVQLIINSGQVEIMAGFFQTSLLGLFSPIIGAFGAFITGSATVSNLMFGNFINIASLKLGMNTEKILALQLVGAAAGNMIALADILVAETVVGLKNKERDVLRGTIIPCAIYVLLVGIIGMIIK